MICILSAMEPCGSYQPWHNKKTHQTYLKPDDGKCLHYCVYFIDEDLGLCSLRVPTWCPFRLQFYCNGHAADPGDHADGNAAGADAKALRTAPHAIECDLPDAGLG